MKSRADTYCRLSLMSNTQWAAVTTWLRPSSVPEHCSPLWHDTFQQIAEFDTHTPLLPRPQCRLLLVHLQPLCGIHMAAAADCLGY